MRSRAMAFVTHIPIIRPVGISNRVSLSCRIEHMIRGVKYGYCAFPDSLFGQPTGEGTLRIGNPIVGVGIRPVKLIATGYPPFDVSPGGITAARWISWPDLF